MVKKVYLINLQGMGDVDLKLVNEETWNYVINGGEVPAHIRNTIMNTEHISAEEFNEQYKVDPTARYADNERAIMISGDYAPPSGFFSGMKEIVTFLKENDLEIEEEYEGSLW